MSLMPRRYHFDVHVGIAVIPYKSKSLDDSRGFSNPGVRLTHLRYRSVPGVEALSAEPHKQEYPLLLAQGLHPMMLKALCELCVCGFPESKTRGDIMAGF
jgi:hypothetical protein